MYRSYNTSGGLLQGSTTPEISAGATVWTIIALVLAIVGGLLTYFMFVKGKNKYANNKFLTWLKDFLDFKAFWIETIAKVSYLVLAIFITLTSFALISKNFLAFLGMLVLGNLSIRVIYEGMLVMLMIWKNTAEINKKMVEGKTVGEKSTK